ncbi:4825_t:CDS:2 [Acaulospora colombiana]|uniref:4825_t:CDS:1 n=1 Tax=Acaulospora colombiana TaxID=27376 RepID=A0ACA9KTX8_9GLOM|nr:4825_t:CDS:2 [Acaulospora colombiana]
MPKKFKGENTKVSAARERKAAHQAEAQGKKQAEKERKEAEEWSVGAKDTSRKEAQKLKKEARLTKKNEAAQLLEKEEKELSRYKPKLKITGEEKKAIKRTQKHEQITEERREIPEYAASNIDDALDLLSLTTNPSPAISGGSAVLNNASNIERHPERRFKAALAAYEEREMPIIKQENPGLRYTQYRDIIFKNFQKSPENPFNQVNVLQYNATRKEQENMIESTRKELENRLQI